MSYSTENDVKEAVTTEVSKGENPADIKGINYDEIDIPDVEPAPESEERKSTADYLREERERREEPVGDDVILADDLG